MSDAESSIETKPTPSDHESSTPMEPHAKDQDLKPPLDTTFRIWPPSQRTRDAVVKRLVESLSTPSILSKRYGTLSEEEATTAARTIEEDVYSFASAGFSSESDDIEVLQVYSKEISKRMLETVKSRAGAAPAGSVQTAEPTPVPTGSTGSNEISSVPTETES